MANTTLPHSNASLQEKLRTAETLLEECQHEARAAASAGDDAMLHAYETLIELGAQLGRLRQELTLERMPPPLSHHDG